MQVLDTLRLVARGGPALCNVAVTNSCNANCDFCNFARDKTVKSALRWIDANQFMRALEILYQRHIRYISFFGGEPLLHPRLTELIKGAVLKGMTPALITNGWLLPAKLGELSAAGLKTVYVSIDAAEMSSHEANRGLHGLGERIKLATARMPTMGMVPYAQVTMSKLITNYEALVPQLRDLGFVAVAFSYPQKARLGSSSLARGINLLLKANGGTVSLKFNHPGVFPFYCRFHAMLDADNQSKAPGPDGGIQDQNGNFGTPMNV